MESDKKEKGQEVTETKLTDTEKLILELELNDEEKEIFEQLKSVLIEKCELVDFEAVDMSKKDDYGTLITYIKNKRIFIDGDGVIVKLRKPLYGDKGDILTDKVKILFERNAARENQFVKGKKIKEGDIGLQREYSRAALAASLDNVTKDGKSIMLSPLNISDKNVHQKDYILMMSCYNFFRN